MEDTIEAVFDLDRVRVFLHVLSITVWVGGQIVLASIMPALRPDYRDAVKAVANGFHRIAWPAYGVALATGFWSMLVIYSGDEDISSGWSMLVGIKILVVLISGVGAFAHQRARSTLGMVLFASFSLLAALVALLMGAILSTG